MAGRPMGRLHQDDVRAKIQTSQLINRLENHAFGDLDLSTSQIKAIEILIRKTLPDLSAVALDTSEDAQGLIAGIIASARQRVAAMNEPEVTTHG